MSNLSALPKIRIFKHSKRARARMSLAKINRTPEEKEKHYSAVSKKLKEYHANKTPKERAAFSEKCRKSALRKYRNPNIATREVMEYQKYLLSHKTILNCRTQEERDELARRGRKRNVLIEGEELARRGRKRSVLIQRDVPRVKNFCGVIRE